MKKSFFLKFENFHDNQPPTRHIKHKRLDFAPCNKSIMAKNFFQKIWNDFKTDYFSAHALIARNILRVNCPKLAKMAILKPP